jgi:hypothetical protein
VTFGGAPSIVPAVTDLNPLAAVEIVFPREEKAVRHVRLWAASFSLAIRDDTRLANEVAMAASELVGNAVRHGVGPSMLLRYHASEEGSGFQVRLEVENQASAARIGEVLERVAAGRGEGADAYLRMLQHLKDAGPAALGLARVRHEARMDLFASAVGTRLRVAAQRSA